MPLATLLTFVILILSIIVHEVAHGYAANSLGDPTARLSGRLTLNPLPHIDLMGSIVIPTLLIFSGSPIFFGWAKPVPYNPYNLRNQRWGEALVAIAGSATNILLAILFALLVRFSLVPLTAVDIALKIALINLFLGLFNLIPFPPLDGFTTLRAALPWRFSFSLNHFEQKVRSSGFIALILFLMVFSLFLADPFFNLVFWIFIHLTGTGAF